MITQVPILLKCMVLDLIKSMHLPLVKPCWAKFTDAGLGVGGSNFEVSFTDAELPRVYSPDYCIPVHRATGDSRQTKAEKTNSAIGDADESSHSQFQMQPNCWTITAKMCLRLAGVKVMIHALLMTHSLDITSKKCLVKEL